jgi:hypothetical protein
VTTNGQLIAALRDFWPDTDREAAEFLDALAECTTDIMNAMDMGIHPSFWAKFVAVADALDDPGPSAALPSPRERLLEAAGQGGVTISFVARLLGVSRWRARQILGELRDEGALRVHSQGRASRWVRPQIGSPA